MMLCHTFSFLLAPYGDSSIIIGEFLFRLPFRERELFSVAYGGVYYLLGSLGGVE